MFTIRMVLKQIIELKNKQELPIITVPYYPMLPYIQPEPWWINKPTYYPMIYTTTGTDFGNYPMGYAT